MSDQIISMYTALKIDAGIGNHFQYQNA